MTQQETSKILAILLETYPAFRKERDPAFTARMWYEIFREVPYEEMQRALMEFIATDTKGFPPVPGALREIVLSHRKETVMTDREAWTLARKAISRGIYNSGEEFRKLPPIIQEAIGSPERLHTWAGMDEYEVEQYCAPGFMKTYNNLLGREYRNMFLPTGGFRGLPEPGN